MAVWHKVTFNAQNIETETAKAVLIACPHKSDYDGYVFWHPTKLVRDAGSKGWDKSFSFTDEIKFNLKKYGKGKYNKSQVIDEVTLSADEIAAVFGQEI